MTNKQKSLLSDWKEICVSENPGRLPVYLTRDGNGNVTDYLVMAKKREEKQPSASPENIQRRKTIRLPVNNKTNKFPYYFVEKNHQKKSLESPYRPKLQKAISETKHTVLTEKNRRVHKNQITGPVYTQPGETTEMTFQKSRRHMSESPRRGRRSTSPRKQKRNAFGQFTHNTEPEIETTTVVQPGSTTPAYEPSNLFMPNLFVNSAEEGEINISTEIEPEGKTNSEIKREENFEPADAEIDNNLQNTTENQMITEKKPERIRRRPNFYGAVRYC